jgi:hypothetical protein
MGSPTSFGRPFQAVLSPVAFANDAVHARLAATGPLPVEGKVTLCRLMVRRRIVNEPGHRDRPAANRDRFEPCPKCGEYKALPAGQLEEERCCEY